MDLKITLVSASRFPEIPDPKTTSQKLSGHQRSNSIPLRQVKLAPEVHAASVEKYRQAGAKSAMTDFFSCQDCLLADPSWQLPTAILPPEESAMVDRFRPLATSIVAFFQAVFATAIFQRYGPKFPVWSRQTSTSIFEVFQRNVDRPCRNHRHLQAELIKFFLNKELPGSDQQRGIKTRSLLAFYNDFCETKGGGIILYCYRFLNAQGQELKNYLRRQDI